MKIHGVFTVDEVGLFEDENGAVLQMEGRRLTVLGLTVSEVRELGKRLYQAVDFELTLPDQP